MLLIPQQYHIHFVGVNRLPVDNHYTNRLYIPAATTAMINAGIATPIANPMRRTNVIIAIVYHTVGVFVNSLEYGVK